MKNKKKLTEIKMPDTKSNTGKKMMSNKTVKDIPAVKETDLERAYKEGLFNNSDTEKV